MPVRATVDESSLIGVEATEGVAPAAGIRTRLLSVGFNLSESAEFDPIDPMGIRVGTGDAIRQNWSTFEIGDGAYMDYNSLAYLMTFLFGPATVVTPGGGTHLAPRTGRIFNAAHLTFGTLNLTGDTILDFSNRSPSFLTAASLNISGLKLCRQISRIKPR